MTNDSQNGNGKICKYSETMISYVNNFRDWSINSLGKGRIFYAYLSLQIYEALFDYEN